MKTILGKIVMAMAVMLLELSVLEETKIVEYQPCAGLEVRESILIQEEKPEVQTYSDEEKPTQLELFWEMEEVIKEALLKEETDIDLTTLNIQQSEYNLHQLLYFSPYFGNGIDMQFYHYSDNTYGYVVLENTMTVEETGAYFDAVSEKIDEIMALLNENMSEEEKALVIHDYLIYEYKYDYDNYLNNTLPEDSYRSSGIIMKETGVCQAYAYAYKYLMNLAGIECYVTSSEAMNHAWNIINIDDEYYHVDCTWDDPVYDKLGQVKHEHFLVSDEVFEAEREHYGWDLTEFVCDDTKYDNYYWVDVNSQIILKDDYAYYIEDSDIVSRNYTDDSVTTIKELGVWYVWDSEYSYWRGAYSGLSFYEDELYYNTTTQIRKISLDGQNDSLVYEADVTEGYLYGSKKEDNVFHYIIAQDPNTVGVIKSVEMKEQEDPFYNLVDVPQDQWYYTAVRYVYDHNFMTGISDINFAPENKLDRAQFAAILYRMENSPAMEYSSKFSDVPDSQWYTDAILWASENGIIYGYTDGRYGTFDNITREQMAVMIYRYAVWKGYDISGSVDFSDFSDAASVSEYANEAIGWAVGNGIISGKSNNNIDPSGTATRAECASIIMRFTEKYEE